MAILNAGIVAPTGGYQISRSLRFNSADSAYLNRTPASAGNRKTWTWSGWHKRSAPDETASNRTIFSVGDSAPWAQLAYIAGGGGKLEVTFTAGVSGGLETTPVYRDYSAWYHIVLAVDTTQATNTNRVKLYVNGVQQAFSNTNYPAQNFDTQVNNNIAHYIGRAVSANYLNGYLTEINFIDGQALTPSSFGETDTVTGVWKPKKYTGTYGTNGFYLNFSDNSGVTSTTLGKDYSGNGNNWTPNNFSVTAGAGNDSLVDTPTPYGTDTGVGGEVRGNYATLNAVNKALYQPTISNGNLNVAPTTTQYQNAFSTISVTSGKWYCEVLVNGTPNSANMIGVSSTTEQNYLTGNAGLVGNTSTGYGYYIHNGNKFNNAVSSAYGNSIASGNVVGIALDLDNGKVWFSKNGTWQASGDPVAGTNAAFTGLNASLGFFISSTSYSGGATSFDFNFGQRPFAYTAPSGFKALCTQNLPEPTIKDGGDYFNTVLWTGTGGARTITGVGFQPDFVWGKGRSGSATYPNLLWDAVRGTNLNLVTNNTAAEFNAPSASSNGGLGTSVSDGFTIVAGTSTADNLNALSPASTYVAWAWKANGAGSSNTAGTITSTVSVNTTSGFSIVTYTGTGANATVGHGLGVVPKMIILKRRNGADNWPIYNESIGATNTIYLDLTNAVSTSGVFNSTAPTSSVFTISGFANVNASGGTYVAYCFAPVAGYSAFGSYTGNGSADGPFLYFGFRPRWIMYKRTDSTGQWNILDTSRSPINAANTLLRANLSNADETNTVYDQDFLSNGWKIRSTNVDINVNGATYIYAAFAENPFKYSLAR